MGPLQIANWPEYRGNALVKYDLIDFHLTKSKHFLASDAKRWAEVLKHQGSCSNHPENAPIVAVSETALQEARSASQRSSDTETPPVLLFKEHEMICLDGQARIRAILGMKSVPGTQTFGVVHIVLSSEYSSYGSECIS